MGCCETTANGVPPVEVEHSIINVGGFAQLYKISTGPNPFLLRSVQSSDASISVVQNVNDIDLTVPSGVGGVDAFQTDSTATRLSNTTTLTTLATMAGTSKMLNGETWKINMGVLVCVPAGLTVNAEQVWQIETSAGVFTTIDRYSNRTPITIAGAENSQPFERHIKLVASMDAPRMRIQVHRVTAGSTNYFWELPRWGGVQIAEAP